MQCPPFIGEQSEEIVAELVSCSALHGHARTAARQRSQGRALLRRAMSGQGSSSTRGTTRRLPRWRGKRAWPCARVTEAAATGGSTSTTIGPRARTDGRRRTRARRGAAAVNASGHACPRLHARRARHDVGRQRRTLAGGDVSYSALPELAVVNGARGRDARRALT